MTPVPFSPAENERLIDSTCANASRRGPAIPQPRSPTTKDARPDALRCAPFAASSARDARTASRPRCSRRSFSKRTATRRWSSASSRSISWTTSSSCIRSEAAGARSRDRAIPACTDASRCSPRHERSRAATSIPYSSISPAASQEYAVVDLAKVMGVRTTGALAATNVWKVERVLLDYPHRAITSSDDRRVDRLRARYRRVPGRASREEAGLLPGTGTVDAAAEGV